MLDNVSWTLLVVFAVLMAVAPLGQTPHLVEKTRMLLDGTLKKPIDIFDLFFHLLPFALIALKALGV